MRDGIIAYGPCILTHASNVRRPNPDHRVHERRRATPKRAASTRRRPRSPRPTPTAVRRSAWCCCAASTSADSCFTRTTRAARRASSTPTRTRALCFHWPTLEEQIRDRGSGRAPAGRRIRRLLRRPPARQPARRVDVGAERGPRLARAVRRRVRRDRSAVRGPTRPPPAVLGRLSHLEPTQHRVLVRAHVDRLHDRILYVREGAAWTIHRLYP